jgi:hypothetical protein
MCKKFNKVVERTLYWSDVENALVSKCRSLSLEYRGKKNDFSCYKVLQSSLFPELKTGEIMIDNRNSKLIYSKQISTKNKNDNLHAQLELSKVSNQTHRYRGFSLKAENPENNCIELIFYF